MRVVKIGENAYKLYIADNPESRTQGLSDIESMHRFEGLMFKFDDAQRYSFWMKDMRFALDFVYVKDEIIVDLIRNKTPESYPESIMPQQPVDTIIELRAGEIDRSNPQIGDHIDL